MDKPVNFRYLNYLMSGDTITQCVSISEAKRRNRKTRWPVLKTFKFPKNAVVIRDTTRTERT